jgi:hypothetical protein
MRAMKLQPEAAPGARSAHGHEAQSRRIAKPPLGYSPGAVAFFAVAFVLISVIFPPAALLALYYGAGMVVMVIASHIRRWLWRARRL